MGKILHPGSNPAAIKGSIKQALGGSRERHRLCFDFNTIGGLKEFFAKCKQAGITHPDSIPVLLHQQDSETVWLVGFKKPDTVGETLGDV